MTNTGNHRLTAEELEFLANSCCSPRTAEIINFSLRDFAEKLGYLGVHELLTIDIDERNAESSDSKKRLVFFIKSLAPTGNTLQHLSFRDESFYFGSVVPKLLENYKSAPWAAKCYLAKENTLVFEDLMSQGFKVMDGQLDESHVKSASMTLARFHASSIILEAKSRQRINEIFTNAFKPKIRQKSNTLSSKWLLAGIEVAEAIANNLKLNANYVRPAYDLYLEKRKIREGRTNVLCHCDLWLNNMMFNQTEEINCRLVDFQMVSYLFYALDVSQIIYLNLTGNVRKNIEKEILKTYHSSLSEILRIHGIGKANLMSLEEVIEDYEDVKIVGLVRAVQLWPIALLNKEMVKEYSSDDARMESYQYTSRKDFVLRVMELDSNYRIKMEEIVQDLIEYMEDLEKISGCCNNILD